MDLEPQPAPPSETSLIHAFLAKRDEPCPGCNYNLRGLTGSLCPECRWTVQLGIVREQTGTPRIAAWLAILSLIVFGAGAAWSLINAVTTPYPPGIPRGYLTTWIIQASIRLLATTLGCCTALVLWKRRGRFIGANAVVVCALTILFLDQIAGWVRALGHSIGLW